MFQTVKYDNYIAHIFHLQIIPTLIIQCIIQNNNKYTRKFKYLICLTLP